LASKEERADPDMYRIQNVKKGILYPNSMVKISSAEYRVSEDS